MTVADSSTSANSAVAPSPMVFPFVGHSTARIFEMRQADEATLLHTTDTNTFMLHIQHHDKPNSLSTHLVCYFDAVFFQPHIADTFLSPLTAGSDLSTLRKTLEERG